MTKPNAIFIHAAVDEAGLTPAQFRVLCHVGRRGECYEAVANMATHCRLHADTVRKSLKELVRLGWLHRQQRTGTTSIYEVCHSKIREHPIGNRGSTPCEIEGGEGCGNEGAKVYPIKVNPNKDICSSKDERAYEENIIKETNNTKALDIYKTYPRKQHKGEALEAINKALVQFDHAYLLERTQLYAKVVYGGDRRFIPLPARWFNSGDFESDPKEWARSVNSSWGRGGPPMEAVI